MGNSSFADVVDSKVRNDVVTEITELDSNRGKLIPFSYYGGKYKHLNWLLPLLPKRDCYVEPYGGSGVVLLNREQSNVETFNDTYSEVTTFFRVLRDNPSELLQKIALTPYSEEAFERALYRDDDISDVEQARRFFVVVNMTYNNSLNSPSWSYNVSYSSRGVSKKVSNYQAKLRRLMPIADRFADVQITNRDAVDVIQTFDSDDSLIYCDPPYPSSVRKDGDKYISEMDRQDHREMAETLRACESDIAVSTYKSELYEELFTAHGWHRIDAEEKKLSASENNELTRTESLYVNYEVTDEMKTEAFS